nr:MAG TPA: hypothetical protein [Caudoviricetes sp.]
MVKPEWREIYKWLYKAYFNQDHITVKDENPDSSDKGYITNGKESLFVFKESSNKDEYRFTLKQGDKETVVIKDINNTSLSHLKMLEALGIFANQEFYRTPTARFIKNTFSRGDNLSLYTMPRGKKNTQYVSLFYDGDGKLINTLWNFDTYIKPSSDKHIFPKHINFDRDRYIYRIDGIVDNKTFIPSTCGMFLYKGYPYRFYSVNKSLDILHLYTDIQLPRTVDMDYLRSKYINPNTVADFVLDGKHQYNYIETVHAGYILKG